MGGFAAIGALQGACAMFFVGDVSADIAAGGLTSHLTFELLCVVALLLGTGLAAAAFLATAREARRAKETRRFVSGAFGELFRDRCAGWGLTGAESEVALLMIKGFDPAEIAAFRCTAPGTVRAQLARIYAKSDCHGRGQFVSAFIESLLDIDLPTAHRPGIASRAGLGT